jgi:hypothetical protein
LHFSWQAISPKRIKSREAGKERRQKRREFVANNREASHPFGRLAHLRSTHFAPPASRLFFAPSLLRGSLFCGLPRWVHLIFIRGNFFVFDSCLSAEAALGVPEEAGTPD